MRRLHLTFGAGAITMLLGLAAFAAAPKATQTSAPAASVDSVLHFTDITKQAGIHFVHNSGRAGKKLLPETLGSGVAIFDADGDGWPDLLFVNGKDWVPRGKRSLPALYHNNHNGTFTDVTAGSGLGAEMYGMGVAVADYDNDGREDLYVTALDGDRLFHNEGKGKFKDVTAASGIRNANFGTSAAWFDYDKDGKVDLFVANYVQWTKETDLWCSLDGTTKSYCTPESYKGTASKLFHNRGGGRFEDVSQKAGIAEPTSKSLGVTVLDYNGDGWPDLFVANDTQPNKLYRNQKNGTFKDEGLESGVAFSEDGTVRGAMGTDAADYDRSGRAHLLVGNFANEMLGLYHNEGSGVFVDEAPKSAVGKASLLTLTFGVFFFDYDLDGWQDIFAANGHLEEEIEKVQPRIHYKEPPLVFRNLGGGGKSAFEDVSRALGADLTRPMVARGAAYGDLDHDGDLDVVVTTNHGPAYVFRNDGGNKNHWLTVKTVGTKSNRDGLGAVVRLVSPGGKQWGMVRSGSSYCSESDHALTFGLGKDAQVTSLTIEWPSGEKQVLENVAANQLLTVQESKGIVAQTGAGSRTRQTREPVGRPERAGTAKGCAAKFCKIGRLRVPARSVAGRRSGPPPYRRTLVLNSEENRAVQSRSSPVQESDGTVQGRKCSRGRPKWPDDKIVRSRLDADGKVRIVDADLVGHAVQGKGQPTIELVDARELPADDFPGNHARVRADQQR